MFAMFIISLVCMIVKIILKFYSISYKEYVALFSDKLAQLRWIRAPKIF